MASTDFCAKEVGGRKCLDSSLRERGRIGALIKSGWEEQTIAKKQSAVI